MSITKYTENLIADISDNLTQDIDIFLSNSDLTDKQKIRMIELLNKSYTEGAVPPHMRGHFDDQKKKSDEFMKNFHKRLTD